MPPVGRAASLSFMIQAYCQARCMTGPAANRNVKTQKQTRVKRLLRFVLDSFVISMALLFILPRTRWIALGTASFVVLAWYWLGGNTSLFSLMALALSIVFLLLLPGLFGLVVDHAQSICNVVVSEYGIITLFVILLFAGWRLGGASGVLVALTLIALAIWGVSKLLDRL
jgi:hypothetical protein